MAHPDEPQSPLTPAADDIASTSSAASDRRVAIAAIALLAAAFATCLVGYVAFAAPAGWFPAADVLTWQPSEFAISRGTAALDKNEFAVNAPDASGVAIVTVVSDFRSSDFAAVAWRATDVPSGADVRMLWRSDYAPSKLNSIAVPIASGHLLPVVVSADSSWVGRITGLALSIRAPLTQPMRIQSVTAKPMGALELLADRGKEWLAFEPWTGTSINTVAGGADIQDLPLPVLAAAAIVLAAAVWLLLGWRSQRWRRALPAAIAVMFVTAWFLGDARWAWNLARQLRETAAQYAGKTDRGRHLAAEDGALYAFIENVREKLPPAPARVFVAADEHYFRDRAAYLLYPHNVHFDPYKNVLPPSSLMKPGDYFVVYQRRGIQYNAQNNMLRWDGGAPVAADLVLLEPGAAVFRIR